MSALACFFPNTKRKQCIEALWHFHIILNSSNINLHAGSIWNWGALPRILKNIHLELWDYQS